MLSFKNYDLLQILNDILITQYEHNWKQDVIIISTNEDIFGVGSGGTLVKLYRQKDQIHQLIISISEIRWCLPGVSYYISGELTWPKIGHDTINIRFMWWDQGARLDMQAYHILEFCIIHLAVICLRRGDKVRVKNKKKGRTVQKQYVSLLIQLTLLIHMLSVYLLQ